ncbi:hypothetical protein FEDK69T_29070 [Flavobacterium enshiense DK69]|nr:hypothetical protein FEDK69T_29070 [Flavobacterium enshiense DK69]
MKEWVQVFYHHGDKWKNFGIKTMEHVQQNNVTKKKTPFFKRSFFIVSSRNSNI